MFNFRREPPPSPPAPQSKVYIWLQITVPIIFAIIMGLATLSFNGYKSHAEMRMDENKEAIVKVSDDTKKELDKKVDNQTMQLMIELQKQQIEANKERQKELKEDVSQMKTQMDELMELLKKKLESK
jgi:hypothetical protein